MSSVGDSSGGNNPQVQDNDGEDLQRPLWRYVTKYEREGKAGGNLK